MSFSLAACADKPLIADGDLRGELTARGWNQPGLCELANLEKPEWVRDIGESFLDAGAQILVANTPSANPIALARKFDNKEVSAEQIAEMCRRGAQLYREAVDEFPSKDRYVFGVIGPVEPLLMLGEVTEKDLADAYANQSKSLVAGGVDAILCRGFTELAALQIAVRAAQSTNLPVIAAMAFDAGADQTETTLGVTVPQMCEALVKQPPSAVVSALGCDGESPDTAAKVVALLRQSTKLPIWVAIDAGLPQLIEGRAAYTEPPEQFAERLKSLVAAGANIIAGRRGVTPAHIAALVKADRAPERRR